MSGSLSEALGEAVDVGTPGPALIEYAAKHDLDLAGPGSRGPVLPGKLAEGLFEHLVVPGRYAPTFVQDLSGRHQPLVREHRRNPGRTEKWDLYVRGFELATGYTELADPVVQRERLVAQARWPPAETILFSLARRE